MFDAERTNPQFLMLPLGFIRKFTEETMVSKLVSSTLLLGPCYNSCLQDPALNSRLSGYLSQINPFLPKLFLVMVFITAIETKLRHLGYTTMKAALLILAHECLSAFITGHVFFLRYWAYFP